jgi:hypothetical protein
MEEGESTSEVEKIKTKKKSKETQPTNGKKRKRESSGIPRRPREKPKRFKTGFGFVMAGLTKDFADDMLKQLTEELEERRTNNLPTWTVELYPANKIAIVLSDEEKKAHDEEYRAAYQELPKVSLKRLEKNADPVEKERRRLYNANPDTKIRKKQLAKRRRQILREIRKNDSEAYAKAERVIAPLFPEKKKPNRKRTTNNGSDATA